MFLVEKKAKEGFQPKTNPQPRLYIIFRRATIWFVHCWLYRTVVDPLLFHRLGCSLHRNGTRLLVPPSCQNLVIIPMSHACSGAQANVSGAVSNQNESSSQRGARAWILAHLSTALQETPEDWLVTFFFRVSFCPLPVWEDEHKISRSCWLMTTIASVFFNINDHE